MADSRTGARNIQDKPGEESKKERERKKERKQERKGGGASKGVENLGPHKNLHTDVYKIFIHNCPNLEATKMSFSRWMDK